MGAIAPKAGDQMRSKPKPTRGKMLGDLSGLLDAQLKSTQDFAREQTAFARDMSDRELRAHAIEMALMISPGGGHNVDARLLDAEKIFQWLSIGRLPTTGELRAV